MREPCDRLSFGLIEREVVKKELEREHAMVRLVVILLLKRLDLMNKLNHIDRQLDSRERKGVLKSIRAFYIEEHGKTYMDSVFRKRLLEKKVLKGIMLTVGEQAIVEALSQVGFDWLFVETEHAPNLADRLNKIVLAAGEVPCLVRLSRNDEISVKRALDAGAAGIIAPVLAQRKFVRILLGSLNFRLMECEESV